MVQSRDQWLESSGTALASGYHNFVHIKGRWKKMGLSRHQKSGWWFEEERSGTPLRS